MLSEVDRTLGRVIAGSVRPGDLPPGRLDEVWTHAIRTSGGEVLAAVLVTAGADIDPASKERVRACLRDAAVTEMLRLRVLRRVVHAFDAAGIRMLLIKGAGLAYTVYPAPHLRPAGDIDVFITRESLETAEAALATAGFARDLEPDAESASMQRHYTARDVYGANHVVDLHWRISNRHVFANALCFEEGWSRSRPIERLGGTARTLAIADALLLACIHRIAHHQDDPHLIWLWDIHLLAGKMTRADVEALAAHAARTGMRAVIVRGLEMSQSRFGTALDPWLLSKLCESGVGEASARFVGHETRHVDLVLSDFTAAATAGQRLRLLREHLWPGLAYMRAKYPSCPRLLLPLAYLYRIAWGAPKWFQSPSHHEPVSTDPTRSAHE